MHTVLVIGGYGFFGRRISSVLARDAAIHLLIGGRDLVSARRLAQTLGLTVEQAVSIDASSAALHELLRGLRVGTVVHTAGPFQAQDYSVARAAIEAGCHYVDLADGRQFVSGIGVLDGAARASGVTVVSGASTVPALTSAVIDRHLPEFERLECVRIGLSSGARAPGLATLRGVFSYGGRPIRVLTDGAWVTAYGWRGLERHAFPPPLGQRWLAVCDVPDLELLPHRYPTLRTVSFKAGFATAQAQWVLSGLAGLVKLGLLANMASLATPLSRISRWLEPLGSDRGGLYVALEGIDRSGQPHRVCWNLLAGSHHGVFIPCGAAIALTRKLAAGNQLPIGALPCLGLITVREYLDALEGLDVREIAAAR